MNWSTIKKHNQAGQNWQRNLIRILIATSNKSLQLLVLEPIIDGHIQKCWSFTVAIIQMPSFKLNTRAWPGRRRRRTNQYCNQGRQINVNRILDPLLSSPSSSSTSSFPPPHYHKQQKLKTSPRSGLASSQKPSRGNFALWRKLLTLQILI